MKRLTIAFFILVLSVSLTHAQAPTYTVSTVYTAPEGTLLGQLDIDKDGNIYFASTNAATIWKVSPDGTAAIFAGGGTTHNLLVAFTLQSDTFPATDASLGIATNVAVDKDGNVYLQTGGTSWKASPEGQLTRFAGSKALVGATTLAFDGPALDTKIPQPGGAGGFGIDGNGVAYLRTGLTAPQVVTIDTLGILKLHAGNGERGNAGDGGPATSAQLQSGGELAVDAAGNVYLAEVDEGIRKIGTDGIITTIVGNPNGSTVFSRNTIVTGVDALDARIDDILYIAVGPDGSVFFATSASDVVYQYTTDGKVTTIAGMAEPGSGGDGGPALSAGFNTITGITVDASGNVYVSDRDNRAIRKLIRDTPLASGGGDTGGGDTGGGDTGGSTGSGDTSATPEELARTDFDGDNKIGFGDFLVFAGAFGKKSGEEGFDSRVDLNDDGEIAFADFLLFAGRFGQDVPQ